MTPANQNIAKAIGAWCRKESSPSSSTSSGAGSRRCDGRLASSPFLHTIPSTKIMPRLSLRQQRRPRRRHGSGDGMAETKACPSRDDGVAERDGGVLAETTVVRRRFVIYLACYVSGPCCWRRMMLTCADTVGDGDVTAVAECLLAKAWHSCRSRGDGVVETTAAFVAMAVVCCHGRYSQRLRSDVSLGHGIVCCHGRHSFLVWLMPTIDTTTRCCCSRADDTSLVLWHR
jgi:hypothetical protein